MRLRSVDRPVQALMPLGCGKGSWRAEPQQLESLELNLLFFTRRKKLYGAYVEDLPVNHRRTTRGIFLMAIWRAGCLRRAGKATVAMGWRDFGGGTDVFCGLPPCGDFGGLTEVPFGVEARHCESAA